MNAVQSSVQLRCNPVPFKPSIGIPGFPGNMMCRPESGQSRETESGAQVTAQVSAQVTAQVAAQVAEFCQAPKSAKEIMATLGLRHWKTFQANYFLPLIRVGMLERTIPDKPRSRLQRYRTTAAGMKALEGKPRGTKIMRGSS